MICAIRRALAVFTLTGVLLCSGAQAWDGVRLVSPVTVDGRIIPYPVFSVFVLPESRLQAGFVDATGGAQISLDGRMIEPGEPIVASSTPGLEVLTLTNAVTGEVSRINVFTLVPATEVDPSGRLNGYRIGKYPEKPLRGQSIYLPPPGFVEVTAENRDVQVSPNFRLGGFLAKQKSAYPKYLVLRAGLLLKLENILAALNRSGYSTSGFTIMSGYRTPFYNRAIGNVPYSRHVWGGAADFYIDESPRDGRMDDLNGDGKSDRADAVWLARFIAGMSERGDFGRRIGGLGIYGSNSAHGPFVHVDVRGARARW